jgi:hypothetical protein
MAKDSDKYRLWQHDPVPPKKAERTVIAKVRPAASAPSRVPASSLSGSAPDAKKKRAILRALRDDEAIAYVNTPKTRRPL